jgi:hypothetical protein
VMNIAVSTRQIGFLAGHSISYLDMDTAEMTFSMLQILHSMIVIFLSCAAFAEPFEFAGQTFNTQCIISSTSTFRDCTFRGCRAATYPNYEGGALCVSDVPVSLIVNDCAFVACSAVDSGGAIFADGILSVSVTGTSCSNCSAILEPFLCAVVNSSATGPVTLVESSATVCSGTYNTIYLRVKTFLSSSMTCVESLNLTANRADQRASGMNLLEHHDLLVQFCVVQRCVPGSLVFFYRDILRSDIRCVALIDNKCDTITPESGMICVASPIVLQSCIFDGNTFVHFLAGSASVTFLDCALDGSSVSQTGSIVVSFTRCAFDTHARSLPDCVSRTVRPTRTASRTPTRTLTAPKTATRSRSKTPSRTASRSMTRPATETVHATRSPAAFVGQTITARWFVTVSSSFRDCTFRGLKSTNGGAIYQNSNEWTLSVEGCIFTSCSASLGGAIYARPAKSLSVTRSSSAECIAELTASFAYLYISSTAKGTIALETTSATACSCQRYTILFASDQSGSGSTSQTEGVNLTENTATLSCTGLDMLRHFRLSFRFCTFARNGPANCLLLGSVSESNVSCLAFLGNVYTDGLTPGMICVNEVSLVLVACLFQGNTAVHFLGQSSGTKSSIQFVRCVFDVQELTVNGSLTFTMTGCLNVVEPTQLTECRLARTPVSTRTRNHVEASEALEPGMAVAAGVATAVLAGVLLVALVVGRLMETKALDGQ